MSLSREELLALHASLCDKGREIMRRKNQDYTAGGGCFDNFRHAEVFGVPGETGLLIRVMDKLMRMKSFITNGTLAVKSESVEDAVVDVINYMVLLAGMIQERKLAPVEDPPHREWLAAIATHWSPGLAVEIEERMAALAGQQNG
jgi:hypothetical protein